jgi:histidinol-phosphate aminotransferase
MTINTVTDIEKFVRPAIVEMKPYKPIFPFEVVSQQLGRPAEQIIKLDANENVYGPSPKVLEALSKLGGAVSIYPDPEAFYLRAMLAGYVGVDKDHILVGAGADELIDLIMRLVIDSGDAIIDCPPTFGMYPFDAALAGAKVISIPRGADFSVDVDQIEEAVAEHHPKLLFVATPNNPDGSILDTHDLARLIRLPLLVVLDEAYIEFSGEASAARMAAESANLIVLRTFSKWAGLAGLRAGYGIFPKALMAHLWKIKQPYNLNIAADVAARASLADLNTIQITIQKIIRERDRLGTLLAEIPFLEPYPSRSNFILCRVAGMEAEKLKAQLAQEWGILIRYFDKPGLRDHIRISVGKPEHTDRLMEALNTIGASHE